MNADGSAYAKAERLGRERLSDRFFFRDFLFSETAMAYGLVNLPDDEELALEVGRGLCVNLLEPLFDRFGKIHIRSAFRSRDVNALGNKAGRDCARNEANYAEHIWDMRDGERKGATACIVVPSFFDAFCEKGDWTELAWWIHDNLPYNSMEFFTRAKSRWAFNLNWSTGVEPCRSIRSWEGHFDKTGAWSAKRILTQRGMSNHEGDHSVEYARLQEKLPE
jgi:hypothetical protein